MKCLSKPAAWGLVTVHKRVTLWGTARRCIVAKKSQVQENLVLTRRNSGHGGQKRS